MFEPIGSIKPLRLFIIHYCKHKGDYDDFSLLVTFNFNNHKDAFCGLDIFLEIHYYYEKDILAQFTCISSANFEIYGHAYIRIQKERVIIRQLV